MLNYSIADFRRDFPNDDACLDYLFLMRYGREFQCPGCHQKTRFYRIRLRKSYVCSRCGHHLHPAAHTIFHKSPTPLTLWFYAIFLMSQSGKSLSYKTLQRQLGVTYKCAYRIGKSIRTLIAGAKTSDVFPGFQLFSSPPTPLPKARLIVRRLHVVDPRLRLKHAHPAESRDAKG